MRIFLFLCFILLIGAGWMAGWFYVAGQVETVFDHAKQRLAGNGQQLECLSQEINGFPFRISLNCSELNYDNPGNGIAVSTGQLKSAAQAYQPNKVVAEIASPAQVTLPATGSFETQWKLMRSSINVGLEGPNRFSLQGNDLRITPVNTNLPATDITDFQLHGRHIGDNAVDIALLINDAVTNEKPWPDYDFNLDLRLDEIYADLMRKTDLIAIGRQKGLRGELHNLRYAALNGGSITLAGPMEVDRNGILTGKFQVTVSQLPKIVAALSDALPKYRDDLEKVSIALAAIGGNQDELSLPISIRNGKVVIGFFPVGSVPPLF